MPVGYYGLPKCYKQVSSVSSEEYTIPSHNPQQLVYPCIY